MSIFELSTHVPNLKALRKKVMQPYDALFLGDPTCPIYPGNFSKNIKALKEGVERVKAMGKRCYLSLYAVPRNKDIPWIEEFLQEARSYPLDAVEVHNLGLIKLLRDMDWPTPLYLGVFANLYTHETAKVLHEYGVERVFPNPELDYKEVVYIHHESPGEVILPVHGKLPLGISDKCYFENFVKEPLNCETYCPEEHWLSHDSWHLRNIGQATFSGKDFCLLEHLHLFLKEGIRYFYIYTYRERPEYVERVGRIYREALQKSFEDERFSPSALLQEAWDMAKVGMCNGYCFQVAGEKYISHEDFVQGTIL